MNAKVAFDGTNYLVVWAQQRPLSNNNYNHELRAARITPAGQILDPNGFPVAPAANKYNTFNVAYSGQVYLVVWEEDRFYFNPTTRPHSVIRAVLVSPAGTVLSPSPMTIEDSIGPANYNATVHATPDVFWDSTQFVVVYRTDIAGADDAFHLTAEKAGIYARRVTPQGQVVAGKHLLAAAGANLVPFGLQRLDYQAGKGLLAFIAYTPATATYDVYTIWLTTPGGVPTATAPQAVATTQMRVGFDHPAVAAVGPDFLAVWESYETGQTCVPDLYGLLGNSTGGTFQPVAPLVQGTSDSWPALAPDGSHFVMVYRHLIGCHAYLGSVRVDNTGAPGLATYFDQGYNLVCDVDVAAGNTNSLVAFTNENVNWSNPSLNSYAVWLRFLDRTN